MGETVTDNRFIHSMGARAFAFAIGLGIFAFMVAKWGDDMKELAASFSDGKKTVILHSAGVERVKNENPALAACLQQRVGDVERMKTEGVINDHQYEQFASRARALCQTQNPG